METKIHNIEFVESYAYDKDKMAYNVHVKILEDDNWVGDFFIEFVEAVTRVEENNKLVFVATPSDVKKGNGRYTEDEPDFGLITEVSQILSENGTIQYKNVRPNHDFKAVKSSN